MINENKPEDEPVEVPRQTKLMLAVCIIGLILLTLGLSGCAAISKRVDSMITGEPVEFQPPPSKLQGIKQTREPETFDYFSLQNYPEPVPLSADGKEYAGFERTDFVTLLEQRYELEANTQLLERLMDLYDLSIEERNQVYQVALEIEKQSHLYQEQLFEAERFIRNRDRIYKFKTWGERVIFAIILVVIAG